MQRIARWHVVAGLLLAIAGMGLGIHMASSHDHVQHVTHAHLLLLGFVVSLLYAMLYRLWLGALPADRLAWVQYGLHQGGTVALVAGLFMLYGGHAAAASVEPLLGAASVTVLAAMVLMLVIFARADRRARAAGAAGGRVPARRA